MTQKYKERDAINLSFTYDQYEEQLLHSVRPPDVDEIKKGLEQYKINNFHSARVIANPSDYFMFLQDYNNKNYVFRGISSEEQKYCKLTRNICSTKNRSINQTDKMLVAETEYIRKFSRQAAYLNISNQNVVDLVAAAQHYTLMTRLIDWSSSPLIATLFSLYAKPNLNKKGDTWYYLVLVAKKSDNTVIFDLPLPADLGLLQNCNNIEPHVKYGLMLQELIRVMDCNDDIKRDYIKRAYCTTNTKVALLDDENSYAASADNFVQNKIIFLETSFSNSRIANQRGLFQISAKLEKEYINMMFSNMDLVFINSGIRDQIINLCEHLGFSFYSLMPDTQSIASVINSRTKFTI